MNNDLVSGTTVAVRPDVVARVEPCLRDEIEAPVVGSALSTFPRYIARK